MTVKEAKDTPRYIYIPTPGGCWRIPSAPAFSALLLALLFAGSGCLRQTDNAAKTAKVTDIKPSCAGTGTGSAPKVKPGTPLAQLALLPDFYQTPKMPYITSPGEQVIPVTIGDCSGAAAQKILEDERTFVPEGVFVVKIDGVITISDTPLAPGNKTSLVFTKNGKIVAAPGCTSKELILIKETEFVSFSSEDGVKGVIDGAGTGATGIRVENSGKVHLDQLAIRNCGGDGLRVSRRGADTYAEPVSLTRSTVIDCKMNGVTVSKSPQFIALDNVIAGNGQVGMEIDSPLSLLANNICAGNETGLDIRSPESSTITRNQLIANKTGLHLQGTCDHALVYENTLQDNELGAALAAMNATLGWNIFAANREQVKAGGKKNLLQSNEGLTAADAGPGAAYFNPPTMSHPHQDAVIWKGEKEGDAAMERADVTIAAGRNPMDATEVTERLAEAREAHPGKVLVATLKGDFIVRTDEGLKVPDYTCVLLEGTVSNEASETQRPYLVSLKGRGCVSFSGGKVLSETGVFSAVTAHRASNACLVEGVTVNLHSPDGRTGAKSVNAIDAKQHGGSAFILRGSEIRDPGSRGVWMHVGSRMYTLGNFFHGGGMTIDFDAFCFRSAALYNTVAGNTYHSAIFFEEAVKFNTAFANHLDIGKEACVGIAFHNQNVKGVTEKNTSACNSIRSAGEKDRKTVGKGPSIGMTGRTAENCTERNYSFNDRVIGNLGYRPIWINTHTRDNYLAQTVLLNSPAGVISSTGKTEPGFGKNAGFTAPER